MNDDDNVSVAQENDICSGSYRTTAEVTLLVKSEGKLHRF